MAATIVTVDGEMVDYLRKAIDDCADRGLQVASKWYACRSFPSLPPSLPAHAATRSRYRLIHTHVLTPRSEGRRASRIRLSRQASRQPTRRPILPIVDARARHGLSPPSGTVVRVLPSPSSTRPALHRRGLTRVARGARARVR